MCVIEEPPQGSRKLIVFGPGGLGSMPAPAAVGLGASEPGFLHLLVIRACRLG